MNESVSHLNERDPEYMKWVHESNVKKYLKELKVTTYTNKVHLPIAGGLIIRTLKLRVLNLDQFYVGWPSGNFPRMHVSEDKVSWKDSSWFIKNSKDDAARSQGI